MPFTLPPNCANWTITITNNGGGISSESSIAIGTINDVDLNQTIVDRVSNLYRDALKQLWDNQWEVGPIHVVEKDGSGIDRVWDDTAEEAGTDSADTYAPPQVAAIVSKQTGLLGKGHRGRCFVPGVPQGFVGEDGGINPTWVSALNTVFGQIMTNVTADAAVQDLALFHDDASPLAGGADVITAFKARAYSGTMRPRNRR